MPAYGISFPLQQALAQSDEGGVELSTDNLIHWLISEHLRCPIIESNTAHTLVVENATQVGEGGGRGNNQGESKQFQGDSSRSSI